MHLTRYLLRPLSTAIGKQLEHYAQFQPSSLSIQQYLDFGRTGSVKSSYVFLKKELLVRLANIMQEIALLPPELLRMSSCRLVNDWYKESFTDLLRYEQAPPEKEFMNNFNEELQKILKRHSHVVETMAEGLIELKDAHGIDIASERSIQYFLDRFYINRISIRMLMNQHLLLFGSVLPESPRHVGCIDPQCDVGAVVHDAFDNARFLCERYYLTSPSMKLEAINAVSPGSKIQLVTVPSHLYHIMFELFKNAMRATVEHYGVDQELPSVRVTVVNGKEDLSIKISDRGGGVSRTILDRLFNYMYSTAPPPPRDGAQAPLAGYGYGLPLSRLYARYFQGDMFLVSMEGYGTDACIYMKTLPPEASEVLPIFSTYSKRLMTQPKQASDWSHQLPGHGGHRN